MKLVFERAKKEDLEEIHEIEIASFPDPWSVDSLWTFASDEQVRTLVCARDEETGELVGYYALQYVLLGRDGIHGDWHYRPNALCYGKMMEAARRRGWR